MLIDNLEQHFESCALNAQNAWKSAGNQIVLIPRKMSLSKFPVVSVFSNMLFSKIRKPGNARSYQKALYIRKHPLLTVTIG